MVGGLEIAAGSVRGEIGCACPFSVGIRLPLEPTVRGVGVVARRRSVAAAVMLSTPLAPLQICASVLGSSGPQPETSHLVHHVLLQHLRELFMLSALTGGFTKTLYDTLCGMYAVSLKYLFGCSCFFRLTNIWS